MIKNRALLGVLFVLISISILSVSVMAVELPFYFPDGIKATTDSVNQWQEYNRYISATNDENHINNLNSRIFVSASDSIFVQTDILSTSTADKNARLKIILDQFVRVDGKIRVTTMNGQRFISEDELKIVVDNLIAVVNQAADNNYSFYKDFPELAIKARALKLGITEKDFRDLLDKKLTGKNVTYREYNLIPAPCQRSDFVPRELHLGYTPGASAIGVTWLNSGIVYYNPQAGIFDYLMGKPLVLGHEMVHANTNLQSLPISLAFDVEMMAILPQVLCFEDKINLINHGYAGNVRELMWVYSGFDFKVARKESIVLNLGGNLVVDEKKYREHYDKLDALKVSFSNRFRDDVIPEFYSDILFWTAMNTKMRDNNFVFQVMMAKNSPTILGANTDKWLADHSFEISGMARNAYNKSGTAEGVTYRSEFLNQAKSLNYTEKQQLAALHHSYKLMFLRRDANQGGYRVAYSMLTSDLAKSQLEAYLGAYNTLRVGNKQYVDYMPGLREKFIHDEEVMKTINDAVQAYLLNNRFKELTNDVWFTNSYDARIFLVDDLSKQFVFMTPELEEAQEKDLLQIVEEGSFSLRRRLDRKEGEPAVWVPKTMDLLYFVGKKIMNNDNPDNNQVDLIEVYRYKDGIKESKPVIRIFFSSDRQYQILVLDMHKEGESGFGLPDFVETITGIDSVEDAMESGFLTSVSFSGLFEALELPAEEESLPLSTDE